MRGRLLVLSVAVGVFAWMPLARAVPANDVSFTASNGDSASLQLTLGTPSSTPGFYNVTSVSGLFVDAAGSAFALTGLLPPNTYAGNDNLFNPSGAPSGSPSYLTFPGLSFGLVNGSDINLAAGNPPTTPYVVNLGGTDSNGDPQFPLTSIIVDVAVVPEPSSVALLFTALAGLMGFGWLRRQRAT